MYSGDPRSAHRQEHGAPDEPLRIDFVRCRRRRERNCPRIRRATAYARLGPPRPRRCARSPALCPRTRRGSGIRWRRAAWPDCDGDRTRRERHCMGGRHERTTPHPSQARHVSRTCDARGSVRTTYAPRVRRRHAPEREQRDRARLPVTAERLRDPARPGVAAGRARERRPRPGAGQALLEDLKELGHVDLATFLPRRLPHLEEQHPLFVRQPRSGDRGETMLYVHLGRGFHRAHGGATSSTQCRPGCIRRERSAQQDEIDVVPYSVIAERLRRLRCSRSSRHRCSSQTSRNCSRERMSRGARTPRHRECWRRGS